MKILDPNVNDMHERMDQSARSIAFMRLKNHLPKFSNNLQSMAQKLSNRFKKMYVDGPEDTLENYPQFVGDYRDTMAACEDLIKEIRLFEKFYLEWMAQTHGEDKIMKLLASLNKGK